MAGRQIYNPDGFKNIEADGKVTGFEFQFKAQYTLYRKKHQSKCRRRGLSERGSSSDRKRRNIYIGRNAYSNRFRLPLGIRRLCNSNRIDRRRTFQRKPPHQYIADYRPVLYAVPDRSDM